MAGVGCFSEMQEAALPPQSAYSHESKMAHCAISATFVQKGVEADTQTAARKKTDSSNTLFLSLPAPKLSFLRALRIAGPDRERTRPRRADQVNSLPTGVGT
jgi:hypothetical protein